jgi:hypothetical protein
MVIINNKTAMMIVTTMITSTRKSCRETLIWTTLRCDKTALASNTQLHSVSGPQHGRQPAEQRRVHPDEGIADTQISISRNICSG